MVVEILYTRRETDAQTNRINCYTFSHHYTWARLITTVALRKVRASSETWTDLHIYHHCKQLCVMYTCYLKRHHFKRSCIVVTSSTMCPLSLSTEKPRHSSRKQKAYCTVGYIKTAHLYQWNALDVKNLFNRFWLYQTKCVLFALWH